MNNIKVELTPLQAAAMTQLIAEVAMTFGVQHFQNAIANAVTAMDDALEEQATAQGLTLEQLLFRILTEKPVDEQPSAALLARADKVMQAVRDKAVQAEHDREVAEADRERINEAMGPGFKTIL